MCLINNIFDTGEIPDILKTGLLTPVYKKKGEKTHSVNYRGITVLPVVCKIIETIIRNRIRPICDNVQNPYQRGFTQNASPLNSALILEEFIRESKDNNLTAYIILLDAKAAFDVVDHQHMLRRLFQAGIQDKHWTLVQSLHQNATSSVKWENSISDPFDVTQGVRQGGILSADLYKLYANPVMDRIQMSNIGGCIGNILSNQSGCADDLTLNTNSSSDSQILTDIAVDNSDMERFELQVKKSVEIVVYPKDKKAPDENPVIYMRNDEMKQVDSATHLGIIRSSSTQKTAKLNVEENIKKARRTVYSLIPSGLHGNSGLDTETKIHLIKTYMIPVLLYGMELIMPNKTLLKELETFQKKIIKQILAVPNNTADPAIYILTGLLPIEAQIDKKVLTLFNNICNQKDTSVEKQIAWRQSSVKTLKSHSWFIAVKKLLWKYDLKDITYYLENPIPKLEWKRNVTSVVNKYWQEEIVSPVPFYEKLCFINCDLYTPGKIHPILQFDTQSVKDNTRLPSKLKFLCGSYVLQTNRQKFNKAEIDPTCMLCGESKETLEHFILSCTSLSTVRDPILKDIQYELQHRQDIMFSNLCVNDKIQLILDCSVLVNNMKIKHRKQKLQELSTLELHNRRLVHNLYFVRYQKLKQLNK